MSKKDSYQVIYRRKSNPDSNVYASRFASSPSEARNMVKADEARMGHVITIISCVKR